MTEKKAKATLNRDDAIKGTFASADRLEEFAVALLKKNDPQQAASHIQSSIILRSLAIEMSLKSILDSLSGGYEKTHNVETLFLALDKNIRNAICKAYATHSKEDWPTALELLNNASNVFVNWRYAALDGKALGLNHGAWHHFGNVIKFFLDAVPALKDAKEVSKKIRGK